MCHCLTAVKTMENYSCSYCKAEFNEEDDDEYDTCSYKRFKYHMMRCQDESRTGNEDEDDVVTIIRQRGDDRNTGVSFEEIMEQGRLDGKTWAVEWSLDWIIDVLLRNEVVVELEVRDNSTDSGFRGDYFRFWYKTWVRGSEHAIDDMDIHPEENENETGVADSSNVSRNEDDLGAGVERGYSSGNEPSNDGTPTSVATSVYEMQPFRIEDHYFMMGDNAFVPLPHDSQLGNESLSSGADRRETMMAGETLTFVLGRDVDDGIGTYKNNSPLNKDVEDNDRSMDSLSSTDELIAKHEGYLEGYFAKDATAWRKA